MTCTFFGHRDAGKEIEPTLLEVIVDLIENKNVTSFYVGNNGQFDYMVRKILRLIKKSYPQIDYSVVLAYMPREKKELDFYDYSDTIFPDGLENTPPRFAISRRNEWMIKNSDYVVTYVKYIVGGAAKFKSLAQSKGKTVLEIYSE